jgi:iron complex outermembrane receptor protein
MKNIYLTLMLLTCSWLSIAQTAILKGQVKTQEGKPAEFVNVILRGTNKGVLQMMQVISKSKELKLVTM